MTAPLDWVTESARRSFAVAKVLAAITSGEAVADAQLMRSVSLLAFSAARYAARLAEFREET